MKPFETLKAVAALCALAIAACDQPTNTQAVAGDDLTGIAADQVSYEMRMYLSTEGVRSGQVHADTAFLFADSTTSLLYGVRVSFYDERGLEQALVVADSGRLNQRTEQMTAWGNVSVELADRGCRITTSEIYYDPPAEQIRTNAAVRFEQGGRVATGSGFRSDMRLQSFSIQNPVGPFGICQGGSP